MTGRPNHSDQQTRSTVRSLAAMLVLVSLGLFVLVSATSLHYHVLPDGRLVVHSHPVDGPSEGGGRHDHTPGEYILVKAAVSSIQADEPLPQLVPIFAGLSAGYIADAAEQRLLSYQGTQLAFRAPPLAGTLSA
jgi:hypothetical protein